MVNQIFTQFTASISDLKKEPMSVIKSAHGEPVAILNRNHPVFYCVPAHLYEDMMSMIDDQQLAQLIAKRDKNMVYNLSSERV